MSAMNPFLIQGGSMLFAVTTSTTAGAAQVSTGSVQGLSLYAIGATPVYVTIGESSADVVTLPSTGTPGGYPLMPNAKEALSVPPACWLSAMTSAGTASLFATPGYGF